MIKRFLLFVLLISPGAVSDAFLAITASTVPDGTISVNEQAAKYKVRGRQALEPSEDITAAAVGEERASVLPSGLEEHLKAASEKMHDWIAWMASRSAFWKKAKSALTKEEKVLQKADDVWEKGGVTGKKDKVAWRKRGEASRVTETAKKKLYGDLLTKDKASLQIARAAWKEKEGAWEKTKAAWETTEAAWIAKLDTIADEAESPSLNTQRLSLEIEMVESERTFLEKRDQWKSDLKHWKVNERDLQNNVLATKWNLVEMEIKTYQPQFEKMKARGVTREAYRKLLGLKSSIIADNNSKKDVINSDSFDGSQYAKYLCFDKYLEYEGESNKLVEWAYTYFRPNEWKA
uniref:RxLR effector candidate protein n=1 Tax=Peronospora matthiolae TaxID=2874970 RepID=A0AAV1TT73_9STRA